ncbi:MFS transporter [Ketogulonicigenium vulgare]|uniref:MFS transporter n=1 Tax=Ketogulonicigenium vulgare TaxID=92945 RepID=UPI0020C7D76E|nr:MFS transporter [Ketogulonicigenium vulgare]
MSAPDSLAGSQDPAHVPNAFAAAPLSPEDKARNNIVIILLLVATFVVFLNETIMSVALPSLMADLNISASAAQWLTSAFLLTMAIVIPTTGFIMQRLTTRAVFIAAMTCFCIGTLVCATAPNFPILLVGRVVQAVGTAIMMPLMMTTVMTVVPPENRGRVMGNISIVISVAPALGPTISGIILELLNWRWMFWLVLPIGLGALALGYALMRNIGETRKAPLDILSVILSAIGFGGFWRSGLRSVVDWRGCRPRRRARAAAVAGGRPASVPSRWCCSSPASSNCNAKSARCWICAPWRIRPMRSRLLCWR